MSYSYKFKVLQLTWITLRSVRLSLRCHKNHAIRNDIKLFVYDAANVWWCGSKTTNTLTLAMTYTEHMMSWSRWRSFISEVCSIRQCSKHVQIWLHISVSTSRRSQRSRMRTLARWYTWMQHHNSQLLLLLLLLLLVVPFYGCYTGQPTVAGTLS